MARGRMLDRRFMESKKLQTVPRDARLAYASILPFLDREGRTIAEPLYLKAMVFRHSDFTIEETAEAVRALADAGLVKLYANEDNAAIIEYVDFSRFNSPNAKEAKSDLPGPDDPGSMPCRDPMMSDAPALPVQGTRSAGGERNVNGTSTSTSTSTGIQPSSAAPTRVDRFSPFVEAWNFHCGVLPQCEAMNDKRRRGIDAVRKEFGDQALVRFEMAVLQVAADKFWQQEGYNIDNLLVRGRVLEKSEKFNANRGMSAGDRKLASTAMEIQRAIGGGLDA